MTTRWQRIFRPTADRLRCALLLLAASPATVSGQGFAEWNLREETRIGFWLGDGALTRVPYVIGYRIER